jgi:serine/threonine-protein kinase RsbT
MTLTELENEGRKGLRLRFEDNGPGIEDVAQAMKDGFSTAGSMGKGLGGAQRLVNEFSLVSKPGAGTQVTVVQWKRR